MMFIWVRLVENMMFWISVLIKCFFFLKLVWLILFEVLIRNVIFMGWIIFLGFGKIKEKNSWGGIWMFYNNCKILLKEEMNNGILC